MVVVIVITRGIALVLVCVWLVFSCHSVSLALCPAVSVQLALAHPSFYPSTNYTKPKELALGSSGFISGGSWLMPSSGRVWTQDCASNLPPQVAGMESKGSPFNRRGEDVKCRV